MYSTEKWGYLFLGICGLITIALFLYEKDYGYTLIYVILFTIGNLLAGLYYFIKDAYCKKKKYKK